MTRLVTSRAGLLILATLLSGVRACGDDRRLLDDGRVYSLRSTVAGSIAVARLAGT
jgi:hypothetical protein